MSYEFSDRLKNLTGNAIREIFKVLQNPKMISFAGGLPATDCLPGEDVKRISTEVLTEDMVGILQYGATEGYMPLRKTYIEFIKRAGIENIAVDDTLIISGGQQGIDLMFKAFLNKGDKILVQNPTYLACLHICKTYEAVAVGVKSNEEGLDLEDFEAKIKSEKPKLAYLVPNFSNPTGKTLRAETRKRVVEIAKKYNLVIIEDDPYRELRYEGEPLPAIKSFDKDNTTVVYLCSASKTVSPGLRVGIAVGNSEIIRKMTIGKQAVDVHTSTLAQAIVNKYIEKGLLVENIVKAVPIYRGKRDFMLKQLAEKMPDTFKFTHPEGGLFIWGEFTDGTSAKAKFKDAIASNVAYVCGNDFYADGSGDNTMRLNFSNASYEQIEEGVNRLSTIFGGKK